MATRNGAKTHAWIVMDDGVRLAATIYLPAGESAQPCLLEALPYRKDDLTHSYGEEYERLRDEFSYAVCRLDLRGTGSSEGIATDEYPIREQDDLVQVIAWLADQPWCDGNVGMYGTSYSGFNSIQAAMRRPPALRAIVPIYATDDRYTDDVHYMGGSLRLLDIVDYPTYMVAMNALPPVPSLAGPEWKSQWLARLESTPPWLVRWVEEQRDGEYWRHGSLRPDYSSIIAPTLIVAGWADGYRNATLRMHAALAASGTPVELLIGPWSHMSQESSRPGPHLDLVPILAGWFDRWLRGAETEQRSSIVYFGRSSGAPPEPDAELVSGSWYGLDQWPPTQLESHERVLGGGERVHHVRAGTGVAAWNSCAGHLPWGQPTDQRFDDAASLTWDWPVTEPLALIGHPRLRLAVTADGQGAVISAKLCDVAPDGTSTLITRGLLPVGEEIELEACGYTVQPGRTLRLSVTGMDWPNTVAPPAPVVLTVDGSASVLTLPVLPQPTPVEMPLTDSQVSKVEGVTWRITDSVLDRITAAETAQGSTYDIPDGTATEAYSGRVSIDRVTWRQSAVGNARFDVTWPEATVSAEVRVELTVDAEAYDLQIALTAYCGDEVVAKRSWNHRAQRVFG